MKSRIRFRTSRGSRRSSGGSALLISLMVVMGLSMLGLAFVSISETESAIAVNQRNSMQAQAIAEAGAKAAVEWFQDPVWARDLGIVPNNASPPAGMKRTRVVGTYSGVYKPLSTQYLFDKPFRPAPQHRFHGVDDTYADLTLNHTIDNTTMVALNTYLFGSDSRLNGRISEILVYAPPVVGGSNVNGFWVGGERFGTATVKVTAEKWSKEVGGTLVSSQAVRVIIGEFPLPVPGGPIQSATSLAFGGSLDVYWGAETSLGNLNPSVSRTRLPWYNPFDRPHFERGYDANVWPILGTAPDERNYLQEILGKRYLDPWSGARARGTNSVCGTCATYAYTSTEGEPVWAAFESQDTTVYPIEKEVTFPTIQYDVWKKIALQGRGMKGLFYFKYQDGTDPPKFYLNGTGTPQLISYWVNINSPGSRLGPGFYFFDTKTESNPQQIGGTTNTAILTPGMSWGASEIVADFKMVGFVYLNMDEFATTGGNNNPPNLPYNMPGEVYRDVGYRRINPATGAWVTDVAGNYILDGAGDGEWSFQDINGNGKFDVVISGPFTTTSYDPGAVPHVNQYLPKTWNPALPCAQPPVDNSVPGASDCSEPHEPYINLIYPAQDDATATSAAGLADDGLMAGWEAFGSQTRKPKALTGTTVPDCTDADNFSKCTSNGYDRDGALVNIQAMMNGVLYNEGAYDAQGGINYFGAVLIRGAVTGNGSVKIWFDEKLVKDDWTPPGMLRVIIYSMQTDEN